MEQAVSDKDGIRLGFSACALALLAALLTCSLAAAADAAAEKAVEYARIGSGEYQNFIRNWDDEKYPLLYALIQSSGRYDMVFHPAGVMGATKPYAPDPALFAREMILVVARVMRASKSEAQDTCFEVERVVQAGQDLAVHYRLKEAGDKASHSIKNGLILRLAKRGYENVFLFENGKQVGVLRLAQGQWSVPAMPEEPAAPRSKAPFTKDAQGIIEDARTGLQWFVGPDKDTPFLEAQSWAKDLSVGGGGWRLPTMAELKRLYGTGATPIVWYDGSLGTIQLDPVFGFTRSSVWSSKTRGSSEALIFQFDNARVEWVLRNDAAMRAFAVRARK